MLEPGRSLTLAEKGGAGAELIRAHDSFRLLATMNPGGDYGKKELSPALSNRFTQIWVPALEAETELALILESRLADEVAKREVAPRLLQFWSFFRGQPALARSVPLSVRDLLSWVGFVNSVGPKLGHLEAYVHGAYLVLLDGIGLGVGMPVESARMLRAACHDFLVQQLPEPLRGEGARAAGDMGSTGNVPAPPGFWGIAPFFIPADVSDEGSEAGKARFDLTAPTTARNSLRVLRAMQLRKAVLLEGSPGVGKTTLIAALARCAGQRLIRINLSEQTDMMDLLGADLPVEGGAPGEFRWCDGPLLQAIQGGHWVLLDELNLASQSVLEGLNAVLDHRAEVFVPELGRTFRCPQSFRLFAAQNPVQEGGGRKGLPKSFLNRFTRVHVELLTPADLEFIGASLHGRIPRSVMSRMVSFLSEMHRGANVERSFGSQGGPWEFNLRDLLRWCHLAEAQVPEGLLPAEEAEDALGAAVHHFVHLLFVQRLRAPEDRRRASEIFARVWDSSLEEAGAEGEGLSVELTPAVARVGRAAIARANHGAPTVLTDALTLLSRQLPYLESAVHTVANGWMCILVGPSGSGKTALARQLASLCGRDLAELSLTSGTDTSDLLGGFEQLEPSRKIQELFAAVEELMALAGEIVLTSGDLAALHPLLSTWKDAQAWLRAVSAKSQTLESAQGQLEALEMLQSAIRSMLDAVVQQEPPAMVLRDRCRVLLSRCESLAEVERDRLSRGSEDKVAGRFEWVDGSLLRAMEEGRWVLLNNANLCNPTGKG